MTRYSCFASINPALVVRLALALSALLVGACSEEHIGSAEPGLFPGGASGRDDAGKGPPADGDDDTPDDGDDDGDDDSSNDGDDDSSNGNDGDDDSANGDGGDDDSANDDFCPTPRWRGRCPDCGNGIREGTEECDDGNDDRTDGCVACLIVPGDPACGDGTEDDGEGCDDGNDIDNDACRNSCTLARCGDGIVFSDNEQCDPPGQACSPSCQTLLEYCGDGVVQSAQGEQCDDGNDLAGDGCFSCHAECGDGFVDRTIGEECEPGIIARQCFSGASAVPGYCTACSAESAAAGDCQSFDGCVAEACLLVARCGDGRVDRIYGEDCDPPNGASCDSACHAIEAVCGNHVVEPGEECDDASSGCSNCIRIGCGNGAEDIGEDCDPPNGVTCSASCKEIAACTIRSVDALAGAGRFGSSGSVEGRWLAADERVTASYAAGEGHTAPGALMVNFGGETPLAEIRGATACVPATRNTQYELRGFYKFAAGANTGLRAVATLLVHESADCTGLNSASVTDAARSPVVFDWATYTGFIDTSVLGMASEGPLSISIRLGMSRPQAFPGGAVFWDDVVLTQVSSEACGNCVTDPGEACDDGNRDGGDGCSADCELDSCAACSAESCLAQTAACAGLTGALAAGPAAGVTRSRACASLAECLDVTGCGLATAASEIGVEGVSGPSLLNCYCGTAGADCLVPGAANGSCRLQIESALESTRPDLVLPWIASGTAPRPAFLKAVELVDCQASNACECTRDSSCGNGLVEDRSPAARDAVALSEALTCADVATDSCALASCGCFFEQCDDGNASEGDGCDAQCLNEVCGNGVLQPGSGEECDDGNRSSGDGCSAECALECGTCGDGIRRCAEECDDGNLVNGDECSDTCTSECGTCGDGERKCQEQCDGDAVPNAGDLCDSQCVLLQCGNGIKQTGEDCDDGNLVDDDSCNNQCQLNMDDCRRCAYSHDEVTELMAACDSSDCNRAFTCFYETQCLANGAPAAECLCAPTTSTGADRFAQCENSFDFQTGPCADTIVELIPSPEASEVFVLTTNQDYGPGRAVFILQAMQYVQFCIDECRLP